MSRGFVICTVYQLLIEGIRGTKLTRRPEARIARDTKEHLKGTIILKLVSYTVDMEVWIGLKWLRI